MAADEHEDWVDRVMARGGWDPPRDFAERTVARAVALGALRTRSSGPTFDILTSIAGIREALALRLEGSLWVLRQYRELLLRS